MGERLLCTQEVSGSIPLVSTIKNLICTLKTRYVSKIYDFTKQNRVN